MSQVISFQRWALFPTFFCLLKLLVYICGMLPLHIIVTKGINSFYNESRGEVRFDL